MTPPYCPLLGTTWEVSKTAQLPRSVQNDTSPYRLPPPQVDLSLFSPVCIPPSSIGSSDEFAGENATAVGWGALEYGSEPQIFLISDLTSLSLKYFYFFQRISDPTSLSLKCLYLCPNNLRHHQQSLM